MTNRDGAPQINVSKMAVSGNLPGLLFAIGTMLIFFFGIPELRVMLPAMLIVGAGVAVVLHFVHRETPGKPWILSSGPSNSRLK
jgi:hypothetical protein